MTVDIDGLTGGKGAIFLKGDPSGEVGSHPLGGADSSSSSSSSSSTPPPPPSSKAEVAAEEKKEGGGGGRRREEEVEEKEELRISTRGPETEDDLALGWSCFDTPPPPKLPPPPPPPPPPDSFRFVKDNSPGVVKNGLSSVK